MDASDQESVISFSWSPCCTCEILSGFRSGKNDLAFEGKNYGGAADVRRRGGNDTDGIGRCSHDVRAYPRPRTPPEAAGNQELADCVYCAWNHAGEATRESIRVGASRTSDVGAIHSLHGGAGDPVRCVGSRCPAGWSNGPT